MNDDISDLRAHLDSIDASLIKLLADRFVLTSRVGHYKKAHHLPAVDVAREAIQFQRISQLAEANGLDPAFTCELFRLIIDEVVAIHIDIATGEDK